MPERQPCRRALLACTALAVTSLVQAPARSPGERPGPWVVADWTRARPLAGATISRVVCQQCDRLTTTMSLTYDNNEFDIRQQWV